MMKTIGCVGLDLGASSGRGILGRFDGDCLELEVVHRFKNGPVAVGNSLYWDVLYLFGEVKRAIARAATVCSGGIISVGMDTWGGDFALLSSDGSLLGNPHCYRDPRTDGMMENVFRIIPRAEIYERTGVQFMPFNTLYQLRAMAVQKSPQLSVAEYLLMMPDLFNFWLSGRLVCEFTDATTTQFYDPLARDWTYDLLDQLDIPGARILPEIVEPGTVLGEMRAHLADEAGVEEIPVVAVASHDSAAAAVAVPAETEDYAFLSSGTWSLLGAEVEEPIINERGFAHNFSCYGGACGTFLIWKNIQGLWLLEECKRVWSLAGRDFSYDELTRMAAEVEPFGPLIDPDDPSFVAPGDMPSRIRAFCRRTDQPLPDAPAGVVRCILESLAMKYRWVLKRLETVIDRSLGSVHIVGGGSRNSILSQLTADATGRRVVAGPAEATAIGNVALQLLAQGYLSSLEEAREVIRASFSTVVYDPSGTTAWESAYGRFCTIVEDRSA